MPDMPRFPLRLVAGSLLVVAASQAHALSNWYFNPQGTGFADAIGVSELNLGGYGFIEQSFSGDFLQPLAFEEHGAYELMPPAGVTTLPAADITVTYEMAGQAGLFGANFSSSLISIYSDSNFDFGSTNGTFGADNGQLIAQFEIVGGSVSLVPLRATLEASLVDGSMASGYFFDVYGNDLAGVTGLGLNLDVASQFIYTRDGNIVSELACDYAGFTGPGCNGSSYHPSFIMAYATVQDAATATLTYNGSAPIVAVPEPTSALMMLAGLLGIGAMRRFRR
jgi:hypothetical protein